jgi:hypothetical protein
MRKTVPLSLVIKGIALFFINGLLWGIFVPACIPTPTQEECFKKQDCLSCTVAFCGWCGARPGVKATGKGCYSKTNMPADCEPPPHYDFCYHDSITPINNRMFLKKPDGGTDAGRGLTDR